MRFIAIILFCGAAAAGCEATPTGPTSVSVTPPAGGSVTSTNNNDNNNDINVSIIITFPPQPQPPIPPQDVPPTTPTPLPQIRTPDPPFGQSLPLPQYTPSVVNEVYVSNPQLILTSCITQFPTTGWAFLDKVVDRLRLNDTRWGYACNNLDCNNPNPELIAYHSTAGPDIMGAQGIITVDIIENYCTNPAIGFINRGFDALGRWSTRNRF